MKTLCKIENDDAMKIKFNQICKKKNNLNYTTTVAQSFKKIVFIFLPFDIDVNVDTSL